GPWLKPTFDAPGIPAAGDLRFRIVSNLLDRFNALLENLAGPASRIYPVRLLGTLTPAKSYWDNEIHPTARGFRRLSQLMIPQVEALVPDGFVRNGDWRELSKRHRGA
ncbi:MAG: hypothetical protein AAGE01_13305, partial [Pseudomonadota bacterium]